ncbi:hypothetical protein ABIB73_000238 [Bradyrhizobium sp. F1.4.3]|uniref:hypothetical protein n=1 Tax=Bradyrhizobium sp. F1.4.3 TaxID=3156356 RepID=UPI00339B60E8
MRYNPDPERGELDQWLAVVRDRLKAYVAWQIKEKCPAPDEVEIDVEFLRNGEFGAFADIQGGTDIIEVNLGTIFILRDHFDGLMSDPRTFPTIVGREAESYRGEYPLNATAIDVEAALGGSARPSRPRHENREMVADMLFWAALYVLVAHELVHCLFGHTRWLRATHNISRIQDSLDKPAADCAISSLDRQTLEMDADAVSAHWIMLNWVATAEYPGPKPDFSDEPKRRLYVAIHLMGIVGLFFLFKSEMKELSDDDVLALPHPPFLHRFTTVLAVLQEQLVLNFVLDEGRAQSAFKFALESWGLTIRFISTGTIEAEPQSEEGLKRATEQTIRLQELLLERWKTFRTELDPFKLSRELPE